MMTVRAPVNIMNSNFYRMKMLCVKCNVLMMKEKFAMHDELHI